MVLKVTLTPWQLDNNPGSVPESLRIKLVVLISQGIDNFIFSAGRIPSDIPSTHAIRPLCIT